MNGRPYFRESLEPTESADACEARRPLSLGAALLRNLKLERVLSELEAPAVVSDRDRALVLGCIDCGRVTDRTIAGIRQCAPCAGAMSRAALRTYGKGNAR